MATVWAATATATRKSRIMRVMIKGLRIEAGDWEKSDMNFGQTNGRIGKRGCFASIIIRLTRKNLPAEKIRKKNEAKGKTNRKRGRWIGLETTVKKLWWSFWFLNNQYIPFPFEPSFPRIGRSGNQEIDRDRKALRILWGTWHGSGSHSFSFNCKWTAMYSPLRKSL